jgi:hypothetical protein
VLGKRRDTHESSLDETRNSITTLFIPPPLLASTWTDCGPNRATSQLDSCILQDVSYDLERKPVSSIPVIGNLLSTPATKTTEMYLHLRSKVIPCATQHFPEVFGAVRGTTPSIQSRDSSIVDGSEIGVSRQSIFPPTMCLFPSQNECGYKIGRVI